jgi:hypothetical protein
MFDEAPCIPDNALSDFGIHLKIHHVIRHSTLVLLTGQELSPFSLELATSHKHLTAQSAHCPVAFGDDTMHQKSGLRSVRDGVIGA